MFKTLLILFLLGVLGYLVYLKYFRPSPDTVTNSGSVGTASNGDSTISSAVIKKNPLEDLSDNQLNVGIIIAIVGLVAVFVGYYFLEKLDAKLIPKVDAISRQDIASYHAYLGPNKYVTTDLLEKLAKHYGESVNELEKIRDHRWGRFLHSSMYARDILAELKKKVETRKINAVSRAENILEAEQLVSLLKKQVEQAIKMGNSRGKENKMIEIENSLKDLYEYLANAAAKIKYKDDDVLSESLKILHEKIKNNEFNDNYGDTKFLSDLKKALK